ncbi:uncharacterized protein Z518_04107 [Rhinocladiella mackenziei CBS 650.93]|uniref:Rhinocladiella mackenziei CBS 650.93 unplaced genomic scaffold supercont1.3, whole genome shotgun sequence n=1 Tax=Rhinocladiella mackenziei CBS 650.93 TaxID=1442369 RepID=A0A0D2H6V2_9EURO|nr:uncharacterized protein Z518_04107 [Rhinocladiella mackenziei CBS 650.93]KIX06133.1 hypothetical protein Z518_04107 [Rhinocladiella mackenziei CBS 650.93]
MGYISQRALSNLVRDKLHDVRAYCFYNQYDPETNPEGIVALAVAENKLMRDEIVNHVNTNMNVNPWHLTYGQGPAGSTALRKALATFVADNFQPSTEINESHICICNGAGSAVDNMAFCVGEPGDGILVGRPLYVGFFPDIEARAKVKPVLVDFGSINPTSPAAVALYEQALHLSNAAGVPIRAVLLSNPHNPLGRPYPKAFLTDMLQLCAKYNIHLISDEVYACSHFPSTDFPDPPSFVSVLSLPLAEYIDPSLVHIIYAMSKDFCANGLRIGALISPAGGTLLKAFKAVDSFTRASQVAEHAWLNMLTDEPFLERYFPLFRSRMTEAYEFTVSFFKENNILYSPASVTSFIWIDLSRYLKDDSLEAELELNWRMARGGVWLAMGASFGSEQNGNYRLTFATPREELTLGLNRYVRVRVRVFHVMSRHGSSTDLGSVVILFETRHCWSG